ncbi:hypothetical protein Tlie_0205 [Thermovirga lienii DSM 17291]|uniref:Uncharacterized protein n=1 Tax=Thermovirga lienii (strain ATCC BAA-1197 / DSM 17291 / Cas60314) TaxID=580340 RepID=G7V6C0_THELD|nr:hypothetical protein [Thermovirga lienii]AER65949.1 hypothetical protein Tlie_0205 [Thermovirga lienii DSM 17291]
MQRTLIDRLVEEVISRLSKPRVAFLWGSGEAPNKALETEAFNAVHYLPAESCFSPLSHLRPCYFLDRLEDIKKEVKTLDFLVALQVSPAVLQELCSAFPISNISLFISCFIDAGKPVIMDLRAIRERYEWGGLMQKLFEARLRELRSLGVVFVDKKVSSETTSAPQGEGKSLVLKDKGWLAWSEVSGMLPGGCRALVLKGDTKLSFEAISRLREQGVMVTREEG